MKHIFALRMTQPECEGGRPIRELFLYETENQILTIDDFVKINSNSRGFEMICFFYGGSMTANNFALKYNMTFRMDLINEHQRN